MHKTLAGQGLEPEGCARGAGAKTRDATTDLAMRSALDATPQAKQGQARLCSRVTAHLRASHSQLDRVVAPTRSPPSPFSPFHTPLSPSDASCYAPILYNMATVSPSSKENVPFHGGFVPPSFPVS